MTPIISAMGGLLAGAAVANLKDSRDFQIGLGTGTELDDVTEVQDVAGEMLGYVAHIKEANFACIIGHGQAQIPGSLRIGNKYYSVSYLTEELGISIDDRVNRDTGLTNPGITILSGRLDDVYEDIAFTSDHLQNVTKYDIDGYTVGIFVAKVPQPELIRTTCTINGLLVLETDMSLSVLLKGLEPAEVAIDANIIHG